MKQTNMKHLSIGVVVLMCVSFVFMSCEKKINATEEMQPQRKVLVQDDNYPYILLNEYPMEYAVYAEDLDLFLGYVSSVYDDNDNLEGYFHMAMSGNYIKYGYIEPAETDIFDLYYPTEENIEDGGNELCYGRLVTTNYAQLMVWVQHELEEGRMVNIRKRGNKYVANSFDPEP